jgi:pimeloyl-ACP methyl ester carboxylesterase
MIKSRPDLFSAFIGTGQYIGWSSFRSVASLKYAKVIALAHAANNPGALQELASVNALSGERASPTPIPNFWRQYMILQKWAAEFGVPTQDDMGINFRIAPPMMPDFSLLDWYYSISGMQFTRDCLADVLLQTDLTTLEYDFSVPIFLFEGTQDTMTPIGPIEHYFEQITAPHKEFVRFDGANHFLPVNRSDDFLKELLAKVRPYTVSKP